MTAKKEKKDEIKKFTAFEHQYILMLASRAKRELQASLDEGVHYLDPHVEDYVKSLGEIAQKAGENMMIQRKKDPSV